jgi:hypothetical protein
MIIVYSEYTLQKMGKSNGKYICKCHLCKNEIESLIHLFLRCHKIKHALDEVKHIDMQTFPLEHNNALLTFNLA